VTCLPADCCFSGLASEIKIQNKHVVLVQSVHH
jgi:hypothetical protein